MKKVIKCQPNLRRRTYDNVITGKIIIQSKFLEPGVKYECTIKQIKQ